MYAHWLQQLGDWNPQLLREIRGRINRRNVLAVGGVALLSQLLILLFFRYLLTVSGSELNNYCVKSSGTTFPVCQVGSEEQTFIQWQVWWFDVFHTLTWILVLLMLALGSYLLVKDIAREARRGTLTFIRLSPQSSQSFLLGKLLGVPILLYLTISFMLPLHIWAAISAGLSLATLVAIYLLAAIACIFIYAFSLFYALGWGAKSQSWYVATIACFVYIPLLILWLWWGHAYRWNLQFPELQNWQGPLANDGAFVWSLRVLAIIGTGVTYRLWQVCNDRFHVPPMPP